MTLCHFSSKSDAKNIEQRLKKMSSQEKQDQIRQYEAQILEHQAKIEELNALKRPMPGKNSVGEFLSQEVLTTTLKTLIYHVFQEKIFSDKWRRVFFALTELS